ncbi:hypothetical protein [Algoriphagus sp.]|uniref:AtuA-related protein n=1 Tax=Algoriphagus sp. TaxID=1872435 RepID=UPI0025E201E3|nr:hypothetical protein [Algoriphagus sp.]
MKVKLSKIAHGRAGDKGNTLLLSVIPFEEEHFSAIEDQVTAKKVKEFLSHQLKGEVKRFSLPELKALQFTCEEALGTGVTTSIAMDAHGKSLSYALLEMEIEIKSLA